MRQEIIGSSVLLASIIVGLIGPPASAADPLPESPSVDVVCPASDRECASLCEGAVGKLRVSTAHPAVAAFFIRRNGDVGLEHGASLTFRFEVPEGEARSVARFEVAEGAATRVIACGPVDGSTIFELAKLERLNENAILTVSVFDRLLRSERGRAELIRQEREVALITSELARHEVEESAKLADVEIARIRYLEQDHDTTLLDSLASKASAALDELNVVLAKGGLPGEKPPSRLVSSRATESASLISEVSAIKGATLDLKQALTRLGALESEEERINKALRALRPDGPRKEQQAAFEQKKAALAKEASEAAAQRAEAEKSFVDARSRLVPFKEPPRPLSEQEREAHCRVMRKLLWLQSDTRRLISRTEIPLVESANLVAVSYGSGPAERRKLLDAPVGLMLTNIPTGEQVALASKRVERKEQPLVELLAQFFALVPASRGPALLGLEPRGKFSFVCPEIMSASGFSVQPDLAAAPVAPQGSRGFLVYGVDTSHTGQVTVCSGARCDPEDKAAPIKNQLELESNFSWVRFTLLADFGPNMEASLGARKLQAIHGAPRFEPVGGARGPDQLFMLRHPQSATQSFSFQLLVAWRPGDHWSVGVGPSLWAGGAPAFSQWNLRVGYAFVPGVSLTAGVGVRGRSNALDYREGQVIAVARPEEGDVSPPSPRTYESLVGVASLGLAVDLSAAGEAGQSLLKSLGVTK